MLVFIDESGDSGLMTEKGSSKFFTVALVVFEDKDEAEACDKGINLLKKSLGWKNKSEFHFKRNSDKVRRAFLKVVKDYNFFYYGIVINKEKADLISNNLEDKKSFYKYACGLVFENAKDKLYQAIVMVDETGNLDFKRQLARYLKSKMNDQENHLIKKVKMQKSTSNNLLQLADYVAGVINRSIQNRRKYADEYRRMISLREIEVRLWPK